jgi:Leucine-rich repeat (LRR) protein
MASAIGEVGAGSLPAKLSPRSTKREVFTGLAKALLEEAEEVQIAPLRSCIRANPEVIEEANLLAEKIKNLADSVLRREPLSSSKEDIAKFAKEIFEEYRQTTPAPNKKIVGIVALQMNKAFHLEGADTLFSSDEVKDLREMLDSAMQAAEKKSEFETAIYAEILNIACKLLRFPESSEDAVAAIRKVVAENDRREVKEPLDLSILDSYWSEYIPSGLCITVMSPDPALRSGLGDVRVPWYMTEVSGFPVTKLHKNDSDFGDQYCNLFDLSSEELFFLAKLSQKPMYEFGRPPAADSYKMQSVLSSSFINKYVKKILQRNPPSPLTAEECSFFEKLKLDGLTLCVKGLREEQYEAFGQILKLTEVKSLILKDAIVNDKLLNSLSKIRELFLAGCMIESLSELPELRLLSCRSLKSTELVLLAPVLRKFQALTCLDLSRNHCDLALFIAELGSLKALTWLNLSNCEMGNTGTASLAAELGKLRALTYLDLSFNKIFPPGAKLLAAELDKLQGLTQLYLSFNRIGDEGIASIVAALRKLPALSHLDISGNNIYSHVPVDLVELVKSEAFTNLLITNNPLGGDKSKDALKALAKSFNFELRI